MLRILPTVIYATRDGCRDEATHLSCGEFAAEPPVASAAIPGSCAREACVDVELGRDMGSRVAGSVSNCAPSSIRARTGGSSRSGGGVSAG